MELNDAQFFRHIAALLIDDTSFITKFSSILDPKYFPSPEMKWITKTSLDFHSAHKEAPTLEVLRLIVERQKLPNGVSNDLVTKLLNSIEDHGTPKGAVYTHVSEQLETFIKKEAILLAVRENSAYVATDPDRVVAAVNAVGKLRVANDSFLVIPDDVDELFDFFNQENLASVSCSTGLASLDRMLGGGLRPKELGVVMAATGAGKSQLLIQFGATGLRMGKNVFHFTLENSKEQTEGRYFTNLLSKPIEDIIGGGSLKEREDAKARIQKLLTRLESDGKIYVQWFSPTITDVRNLAAFMESRESDGIEPGLIIVDYGDLMNSTSHFDKRYDEQQRVFSELRGLAAEHDVPMWTATQTNRTALRSKNVRMDQISESYGKAMEADVIIALSQTDDESMLEPPEMRIQIIKMRRDKSYGAVRVFTEFELSRVVEIGEESDFGD